MDASCKLQDNIHKFKLNIYVSRLLGTHHQKQKNLIIKKKSSQKQKNLTTKKKKNQNQIILKQIKKNRQLNPLKYSLTSQKLTMVEH